MKHIYSILCSDILTDRETNSTSYYKAIDQIISSAVPLALPVLAIGVYFELNRDPKKTFSTRFRIFDPGKEEIRSVTIPNIKKDNTRHRVNIRVLNMVFKSEGNYQIVIDTSEDGEKKWVEQNRINLPVAVNKSINELEH